MPYNYVANSLHTKKLCSRLSSSKVLFHMENGHFAFLSPLWGLGTTYDVHLRLIGKRTVDYACNACSTVKMHGTTCSEQL